MMKAHKKVFMFLIGFLSILVCFSGVSTYLASATTEATYSNACYEDFNSALMKMHSLYDDFESDLVLDKEDYLIDDEQIYLNEKTIDIYGLQKTGISRSGYFAVSDDCVEMAGDAVALKNTPEANRLIVVSEGKVDSFGAVLSAEYLKYHIFQYDSREKTEQAFERFQGLNINVSYDYVISENDFVVDTATTYKSWGAQYVGYGAYAESLLKLYNISSLPTVVVAVLDSGIYAGHELFAGRIYSGGKNFTNEGTESEVNDYRGHGTHVSGTIAESTLSNVKILPLKILRGDGKGSVDYFVNALIYLKELRKTNPLIKLANMSVGIEKSSNSGAATNSALMEAVKDIYDADILPIVSAGNEQVDTSFACPANVPEAITVSALKHTRLIPSGNYIVEFDTSYSNFGSFVDFCAPGTSIQSAGITSSKAYVSMSGTSMAAPHVTAAYACVFSSPDYNTKDKDEITTLLQQNATDLGVSGWDKYYGYGCVNIEKIGVKTQGYVQISTQETTSGVDVILSYTTGDAGVVNIYYTLDENESFVDRNGTHYVLGSTITIKKATTKITAVAYVISGSGSIVSMSYITSHIYYYDNVDIASNFEMEQTSSGVFVTKYNGVLSTLNMSSMNVAGIGNSAFQGTAVEHLILPKNVPLFTIGDYAFSKNSLLKSVVCENSSLIIGNRAFYECNNLEKVSILNVQNIGELAFAYCTKLQKLELPYILVLGKNALSGSGVKVVMFGKNLQTIDEQRVGALSLETVYGYADTEAKGFATLHDAAFYDLTLRFTEQLDSRIVEQVGTKIKLTATFVGWNTSWNVLLNNSASSSSVMKDPAEKLDDFRTKVSFSVSNLAVASYTVALQIYDRYNQLQTSSLSLQIVSTSTLSYSIEATGSDYDIYVDGRLYEAGQTTLYRGQQYSFQILPHDGYDLVSVSIDGVSRNINEESYKFTNSKEILKIDVVTIAKDLLTVTFNVDDSCVIVIKTVSGDQALYSNVKKVGRFGSLEFKIVPNEGYDIKSIDVNGESLTVGADGYYHLDNIVVDKNVNVNYLQKYYNVTIIYGKGFNVSATGELESKMAHGSSRTYKISTIDGYAVDYVTVNGKRVTVRNNSFTIENVSGDVEIVVQLKKANSSIFTSKGMTYIWIILAVFIGFVIANFVLKAVKKKQNEHKNTLQ